MIYNWDLLFWAGVNFLCVLMPGCERLKWLNVFAVGAFLGLYVGHTLEKGV